MSKQVSLQIVRPHPTVWGKNMESTLDIGRTMVINALLG